MDPRPSGHAGFEVEAAAVLVRAVSRLARHPRPRANDAHVPLEHVPELRDLVHRPVAQHSSHARDARVAFGDRQPVADVLRADHHGAELETAKILPPFAYPVLNKKHRPAVIQLDPERDEAD